ncbi:hypothetical protein [Streptomyces sp. NBC_00299]|uniref:hypothetical protein n=1 Tax=Streptomyces sp. NBC_00299 TaxID=2975705 RepID=UPI002E29D0B4|nr:hypothetical protein [Streptomyces sp. NBC_00299]
MRSAGFGEQGPLELADDALDPLVLPGVPDVGGGAFGEESEEFRLRPGERWPIAGADQYAVPEPVGDQGDAELGPGPPDDITAALPSSGPVACRAASLAAARARRMSGSTAGSPWTATYPAPAPLPPRRTAAVPPVCAAASRVSSAYVTPSSSVVPIRSTAMRGSVSRDGMPTSCSGTPGDATGRTVAGL